MVSPSDNTMLKTIIFDCDGVMFDSKNANREYYNALLNNFGKPHMDQAELDYVHIHNVYDSVRHIFRHYPEINEDEIHRFRKENSYLPYLKYMDMEKDLLEFLEITSKRFNLAIATNRTDTMIPLLNEYAIDHYFGKVMTPDNSRKPKPAPDPLLEIIEYFDCEVEEAIYIGDSTIDEETADGCNMQFIAFKNQLLSADFYVNNFLEILQLPPLAK